MHRDPRVFIELVAAASNELRILVGIIERNYYVTLTPRELSSRVKNTVFKGGISLTKRCQVLNRFSEDVDISYTASEGAPGESRKRQLKRAVVSAMEALQLPIISLDDTRNRRSYNRYRATYPTCYASITELKPELMTETYTTLLPFPAVTRMADNYIHRFLREADQEHPAGEFDLMPFSTTTQAIERALINKVSAIYDYYLADKVERHSRHLYDIYRILDHASLDESPIPLIQGARQSRSPLAICPSTEEDVCVHDILTEIIEKDAYKADCENIIRSLLSTDLPYGTVMKGLENFPSQGYFK